MQTLTCKISMPVYACVLIIDKSILQPDICSAPLHLHDYLMDGCLHYFSPCLSQKRGQGEVCVKDGGVRDEYPIGKYMFTDKCSEAK